MEWNPEDAAGGRRADFIPTMHVDEFREILREILDEELALGEVRLEGRWQGGTVVFQPADPSLKPKEIPLESFFHKLVMVRDRLRVLEQKINAHPGLTDEDKVEMQQFVTRIYGTLTTFNIFFRRREDQFQGTGGKD